ncbi:MAG: tRNA uridine-5-carboxymethylaminomethyl(34) synthesis GTPase MnmE, partial [Anaeroplasmataceae bacterium]
MIFNDICAIATAGLDAAISVIRTSGPNCIELIGKIIKKDLSTREANTVTYGFIYDGSKVVDEVLVTLFKAPKSFTGENSVEISCHGGTYV